MEFLIKTLIHCKQYFFCQKLKIKAVQIAKKICEQFSRFEINFSSPNFDLTAFKWLKVSANWEVSRTTPKCSKNFFRFVTISALLGNRGNEKPFNFTLKKNYFVSCLVSGLIIVTHDFMHTSTHWASASWFLYSQILKTRYSAKEHPSKWLRK